VRFLLGNFRLKLVAAALAVAFWSVVAYTSNPTNTSVFYVPIDHPRLPPGLVVLGTIPPVRVTVTASNDVLHGFDAGTLRAIGDFSKVKVGRNLVPVQVSSTDPAVNSNLQYDTRIALQVDQLASANEPVVIRLLNSPPDGFHQKGQASADPASVTVQGPKSGLLGSQAVVTLDLAGRQGPSNPTVIVRVLDSYGKPLEQMSAVPAEVTVHVVIEADAITETKAVGFSLTGQPATGYRVVNAQVNPLTVTVTGLAGTLAGLTQIGTDPVDISGVTSDVIRTVLLRPPAGVQASVRSVQVRVFIARNPQVSPSPSTSP
jgi:YbbR domain-containing protein